jgi:hypothetical protein
MRSQFLIEQEREKDNHKNDKQKNKGGGRPHPFVYHFGVMRRFWGTLLQEGFLAFVLAGPIYLIFLGMGIKEITIPANFVTLWAIALIMFLLQNSMFHGKGG